LHNTTILIFKPATIFQQYKWDVFAAQKNKKTKSQPEGWQKAEPAIKKLAR